MHRNTHTHTYTSKNIKSKAIVYKQKTNKFKNAQTKQSETKPNLQKYH